MPGIQTFEEWRAQNGHPSRDELRARHPDPEDFLKHWEALWDQYEQYREAQELLFKMFAALQGSAQTTHIMFVLGHYIVMSDGNSQEKSRV